MTLGPTDGGCHQAAADELMMKMPAGDEEHRGGFVLISTAQRSPPDFCLCCYNLGRDVSMHQLSFFIIEHRDHICFLVKEIVCNGALVVFECLSVVKIPTAFYFSEPKGLGIWIDASIKQKRNNCERTEELVWILEVVSEDGKNKTTKK